MGYLTGYDSISRAAKHRLGLPTEKMFESFQLKLFDLIYMAYITIKTPEPITENPDEKIISVNLFRALEIVASRDEIPLTVTPERHEITDEIAQGIASEITSKKYDIYFGSWNSKHPIKYGVEAKILTENNFMSRIASTLIREYVSNSGMGKYINGIYKERGCMIGYVVQGEVPNIVKKINTCIEKEMNKREILIKDNHLKSIIKEVYKSQHKDKLSYDLYHLMLTFN